MRITSSNREWRDRVVVYQFVMDGPDYWMTTVHYLEGACASVSIKVCYHR